jgi:hypothetical protein
MEYSKGLFRDLGMDEIKPKKVVSRNVAVALGIICVILVASLSGTLIETLNALNDANQQNKNLQNQLDDVAALVMSVVSLRNYSVSIPGGKYWEQEFITSNYPSNWTSNFPGVLEIIVVPSNPNLWIRVHWTYLSALRTPPFSAEISYLNKEYMQNSTTAYYFPVVVSSAFVGFDDFDVGNNSTQTITANVTVTYYY